MGNCGIWYSRTCVKCDTTRSTFNYASTSQNITKSGDKIVYFTDKYVHFLYIIDKLWYCKCLHTKEHSFKHKPIILQIRYLFWSNTIYIINRVSILTIALYILEGPIWYPNWTVPALGWEKSGLRIDPGFRVTYFYPKFFI